MLDKRKFYINGEWVAPIKEKDFEVINPCNEDPFATISLGSKEDTDKAVNAARNSFKIWKESTKGERLNLLEKLLIIYKKRFAEMAEAISLEMGAPIDWATNVQTASGQNHLEDFPLENDYFGGCFTAVRPGRFSYDLLRWASRTAWALLQPEVCLAGSVAPPDLRCAAYDARGGSSLPPARLASWNFCFLGVSVAGDSMHAEFVHVTAQAPSHRCVC